MKNRKFLVITIGFVLALIGLGPVPTNALSSFTPSSVKTWTGGGSDGDWSTSANWSGGVAPANGDSVIIDNSANFSNGSTVDTALSLYSLSFINNASSPGVVYTDMMQDLTITHDITQQASATSTFNIIRAVPSSVRTLHLGGNVTVTSKYMMRLGDSDGNDFIELNNYDLTFNDQGTDSSVEIYSVIHGTGVVTFDAQNTDFTLYASNTYSGPTNVTSSKSPVTIENATLGSSRIYIGPNGSLALKSNTSQTFPNNIEVSGMPDVASSSPKFIATASGVTFTVPNITLDDTSVFETNLQNQAGVHYLL